MAKEKITWFYEGPIYRFGKMVQDYVHLQTKAVSKKQAINNFLFKAAEEIGYDRSKGAAVDIDRDQIWSEDEKDGIDWATTKTCDKCGRNLTDNGECPYCDLGDEDA